MLTIEITWWRKGRTGVFHAHAFSHDDDRGTVVKSACGLSRFDGSSPMYRDVDAAKCIHCLKRLDTLALRALRLFTVSQK
jgi:hypothetical protein